MVKDKLKINSDFDNVKEKYSNQTFDKEGLNSLQLQIKNTLEIVELHRDKITELESRIEELENAK